MTVLSTLQRRRVLFAYLMIAPGLALLLLFTFYPIVYGIPIAFTNYSVVDVTKWVGWRNFDVALHDPIFITSLKHSLYYLAVVPAIQILSISMAILINSKLRGVHFFRVSYFIPVVTSMVASAIAWKWMFQGNGILNYFLQSLGFTHKPIAFLAEPSLALYAIMCVTIWKGLGYYMMIYLAGLQSIPAELQEAAKIDGAGITKVIWHITIPLLKPFVLLCSLLSTIGAIRVFDEVYVMTGETGNASLGGPANATMVSGLYTYYKAFIDYNFGYSAAMGLIVSLIIMVFSIGMLKYGSKGGVNYYG